MKEKYLGEEGKLCPKCNKREISEYEDKVSEGILVIRHCNECNYNYHKVCKYCIY